MLLEILDDAGNLACSGCRRETSAADATALPLSFGVESPADHIQLHVRIRLYRHSRVGSDGLPAGTALLDTLARLPPASSDIRISIPLLMDCFGVPSDPVQHLACDAQTRTAGPEPLAADGPPSVTASWPAAQAVDCAGAPPDGMLCQQAGLILMGSADTPYSEADYDPLPERLVRVSPFALDAAELTVGKVRALLQAGTLDAAHAPTPRATDLRQADGECTYLDMTDPTNDALPVNCLTLEDARAVCSALGNRLPTEAEWELVARNGASETTYPWGDDDSACARAIVGRGRNALEGVDPGPTVCRTLNAGVTVPPGPIAGGSAADVTLLGIRDLGGNVAEWVADAFQPYDGPCWSASTLLQDPLCTASDPNAGHSVRGGSWSGAEASAEAAVRSEYDPRTISSGIGVRCARSMGM